MKISGKFILKVAGTLTVISLVVAALLGFVNSITAEKIAAIDAENTKIAMSAVAPEGSEFGDKMELPEAAVAAGLATMAVKSDEVRGAVASALDMTASKRVQRLPKKHGNMAL